MQNVCVGVGSNLGDRVANVRNAYDRLRSIPDFYECGISSLYVNPAVGPGDQPDYVNAVIQFKTELLPEKVLDCLQSIEDVLGRERRVRWGARTIDLDILLFGDQVINSERLIVPHPRMFERAFVLVPLLELLPNIHIVGRGSLQALLTRQTDGHSVRMLEAEADLSD